MKKPIWNTIVQIVGKAGMVLISMVTTGILTRKLGVESYGAFVLISSMFVLLDSLADFGTKTIGVREVAKQGNLVLREIFGLRLLMALIATFLGIWWVGYWPAIENIRLPAMVSLLMIVLTSYAGYMEIVFQAKLRMDLKAMADITFPLGFLIWIGVWPGSITLMGVFLAYLMARGISLIFGYFLVKDLAVSEKTRFSPTGMKKMWQMSWPMGVFLLLFATYDRAVDTILIQNFWGATAVAWYGLSYKIYGVMIQPAYYFVNSIFPMLSANEGSKKKLFLDSWVLLFLGALGVVLTTWVLAPWMVEILGGGSFGPAVAALRILILGAIFSYFGHLFGFTLISKGGQKEMILVGAAGLVFNLGLNWILIPRFGWMAAAWITVATEALDMAVMGWLLRRKVMSGVEAGMVEG